MRQPSCLVCRTPVISLLLVADEAARYPRKKGHSVPPQEILEVLRDEKLRRAIHQAREDGLSVDRLMPQIDENLWMSEREVALITFPKMDGSFDYLGFSSKDESAHSWCTDLFQHLWERAEP
jgi:predicted transcriptional regulator